MSTAELLMVRSNREICCNNDSANYIGGGDWPSPSGRRFTKEECLALNGWCSHRACNLDVGDPICNCTLTHSKRGKPICGLFLKSCELILIIAQCLNPLPFRDGVCGAILQDLNHNAVNRPDVCAVTDFFGLNSCLF